MAARGRYWCMLATVQLASATRLLKQAAVRGLKQVPDKVSVRINGGWWSFNYP